MTAIYFSVSVHKIRILSTLSNLNMGGTVFVKKCMIKFIGETTQISISPIK